MKKLLFILISLLFALGIQAANEFRLGYCEHKITEGTGEGSSTAGEISAAIFVPETKLKSLAGNSISRIDVGITSRINVKNLKVWIRTELNGTNLAEATVERAQAGWNEVSFTSPYIIKEGEKGLYIGYNFDNSGSSHPVSFVGTGSTGLSFFKEKADGTWRDMASVGNLSIEAIVTGSTLPMYDLALNSVTLSPNLELGNNGYTLSGTVSNMALADISGFELTVSDATTTKTLKVGTQVKSGQQITFSTTFITQTALSGEVTVSITKLNEGTDANTEDNTLKTTVSYLRNVIVEEFTTEKCPNCPTAANGLHQALGSKASYAERVIPVCHHAGFGTDWLTRPCDEELLPLYNANGQTYAPAFMFDRQPIYDNMLVQGTKGNVVGINQKNDFIECIDGTLALPTHAIVGITLKKVDSMDVTFEVSVMHDGLLAMQNPTLTVYLTEDDIKAKNQQGADGAFYHQHVIRWDNGAWGETVSFNGNSFKKTYTVTIDEEWVSEKMHIVAFLANHNVSNPLDNRIENAATIACPKVNSNIPTDKPITDRPTGKKMEDVIWSSKACSPGSDNKVAWTEVSGFVPDIVTNGSKMYINSPITQLAELAQAWIVGQVSADGNTVTFHTPQPYMINNGSQMLYATRLNSNGQLDASNTDLVFSYQDGNMKQIDGGVLAICDEQGRFYGYGDMDINITKVTEEVCTLPADAKLESYTLEYGNSKNRSKQTAKVAFCGTEVYISDPLGIENSWYKGTLNGNTISVPTKQYLGTGSGYPMYINSGQQYTYTQTNAMGQPETIVSYHVLADEAIVFTFDADTHSFTTNQTLLINSGRDVLGTAYVGLEKPSYEPWTQVPAIPANPSIEQFIDLDGYAYLGMKGCLFGFTVPSHSTKNEFMAQEDIYYMFSFDDEPVEMYGATTIPYYGSVQDAAQGLYITCSGDSHQLQIANKPKNKVSIQSFYVVGDNYYSSDVISYDIINGELVNDIAEVSASDREIKRTNFYDITGKKVNPNTARGIIIREDVYSSGNKKTMKINNLK